METPELDKMQKVKDTSQSIGEFLDWLMQEKNIVLSKHHAHNDECKDEDGFNFCGLSDGDLISIHTNIERLLAEYFEIDLKKVEEEKTKILEEVRSKNG